MTFKNLLLALTLVTVSTQSVFSTQEDTGTMEITVTAAAVATPVVASRFSIAGIRSAFSTAAHSAETFSRKILGAPAQAANFVADKAVAGKNAVVAAAYRAKNAVKASAITAVNVAKEAALARAHQVATLVAQNKLKSAGIAAAVAGTIAAGYFAREVYKDYQYNRKPIQKMLCNQTVTLNRHQAAAFDQANARVDFLCNQAVFNAPKSTLSDRCAKAFARVMQLLGHR